MPFFSLFPQASSSSSSSSQLRPDAAFAGRVTFLQPPEDGGSSSSSGVAVIDEGPFAGQRVEFERQQASVLGRSLAKADLGQVFAYGKK